MLPYALYAMTMKAVGDSAVEMMAIIIQDYKARENHLAAEAEKKAPNPEYVVEKLEPDY